MKTLLQGMPYKPSTERQDVQETWAKYGWTPPREGMPANVPIMDDYELTDSTGHLDFIGSFK